MLSVMRKRYRAYGHSKEQIIVQYGHMYDWA